MNLLTKIKQAHGQCCNDCIDLLRELSAQSYRRCIETHSSIGTHVRHVVEFYSCFFDGVQSVPAQIDYDTRPRDKSLEMDKDFAIKALRAIKDRLVVIEDLEQKVAVYEGLSLGAAKRFTLNSSAGRELVFIHSHFVHHMGIIRILAELQGIHLPDCFGKAAATLNFERKIA